jgi:hypothetical protein
MNVHVIILLFSAEIASLSAPQEINSTLLESGEKSTMILKGSGDPQFKTKHITSLWKSKIPDLKTLKELIPRSFLVALDIESSVQGVSEIGLAFFRVHGEQGPQFPGDGTLRTFYSENEVQAHTIQVRNKIAKKTSREAIKYGDTVVVDADQVASTVMQILSLLDHNGSIILVGFDTYTEFKWISQECPPVSSIFTSWVDLQDIAFERSSVLRPGLLDTMNAMHIVDRREGTKARKLHRASNDAVRCLAVLSGLSPWILSSSPRSLLKFFFFVNCLA